MLCEGGDNELVVHCAWPEPFRATFVQLPIATLSDLNVTVPVGVRGKGGVGVCEPLMATVAVKVIESPWFAGFRLDPSVVVESNRSTGVLVGSVVPPTAGSSVFGLAVEAPFTRVKLLPDTVPCVVTCGGLNKLQFGGLFSVTLNTTVTLLPAGRVPIVTFTSGPTGIGAAGKS